MRTPPGRQDAAVLVLAMGCGAALIGCPAVPDIYFVTDGSTDSPQPTDGGPRPDVTGPDAAEGGGGTCQGAPPVNATCCGATWCVDCPQPQHCTSCVQANCGVELCCGKGGGNVVCKPTCP